MQAQRALATPARSLTASLAKDPAQILAAQRLRFAVFSEEYGADLGGASEAIDADRFDPHCDHIIVTNQKQEVVATTRILLGTTAAGIGGFYSEDEFTLTRLKRNPGHFAELGRTCVRADYRQSVALSMLWTAICQHLLKAKVDYLIGCASISMLDGGRKAWRVTEKLQAEHLAPAGFQVSPKRELPHIASAVLGDAAVEIPPLIKAYLRLGAVVCGPPCWDPAFRCADLLVLLEVKNLAARYARKYMRT